jgi:cytochrome c biogenesis protein CcmG/thiol:disulfide interchange protein DsbE
MSTESDSELNSRPQSRREWSGYMRSLVLPLGLVVAIVAGLLWWQSRGSGDAASDGYGTVALPAAKNVTSKSPSPVVGRAAPDFELQTSDGQTIRLSDLQGHPVLLNFWASWCTNCRQETPDLIKTDQQSPDGLKVVGVNLREAPDRVKSFGDEYGIPYPLAFDKRGEVARTWRIGGPNEGLPSSYFIDSKGVVQKVVYGSLTAKLMSDGMDAITKAGG